MKLSMKRSMKNKAPSLKKIKSGLSFRRSKLLQKGTRKSTVAGIPDAVSFESNNADAKKADDESIKTEENKADDAVMDILENKASEMSVSSAEREASPVKEMEEPMEPEQEPAPQEPEGLAPEPELEPAKLEPEEALEETKEEEPKEEEELKEETEEATEEASTEEAPAALADDIAEDEEEEEPEEEEKEQSTESPNQEAMDADIEAVQQNGRVAIGFCTPTTEETPASEEENDVFTHTLEMMGQYFTCFPSAAPKEGEVAVIDTTSVKEMMGQYFTCFPSAAPKEGEVAVIDTTSVKTELAAPIPLPTETELSPEMDDRNDESAEEPAALEMAQQEIRV